MYSILYEKSVEVCGKERVLNGTMIAYLQPVRTALETNFRSIIMYHISQGPEWASSSLALCYSWPLTKWKIFSPVNE